MLSEQTIIKILSDPGFDVDIDISAEMDEIAEQIEWLKHPVVIKYALKDENAAEWAYYYARDVIKGRWPEGEEAIKRDPFWATNYAMYVIRGKWPEGEKTIKKDPWWWRFYCSQSRP